MSELTPSHVANAQFRTVRKGYDPDEVDAFLSKTSRALEEAQQQATAMEARARAAVARLQELTTAQEQERERAEAQEPTAVPVLDSPQVSSDEAETISRTLLLAQRTADQAIADARREADRLLAEARAESEATIDSTREMSSRLLDDARTDARVATEFERAAAEGEVQALAARREFLIGDVDQLEQFLDEQRERLRAAARQLEAICDRIPAGLATAAPPAMAGDATPAEVAAPSGVVGAVEVVDVATAADEVDGEPQPGANPDDDTAAFERPTHGFALPNRAALRDRPSGPAT